MGNLYSRHVTAVASKLVVLTHVGVQLSLGEASVAAPPALQRLQRVAGQGGLGRHRQLVPETRLLVPVQLLAHAVHVVAVLQVLRAPLVHLLQVLDHDLNLQMEHKLYAVLKVYFFFGNSLLKI